MNKQTAIKEIKNGATLHIQHFDKTAHVCTGAGIGDNAKIRYETAKKISENFNLVCGRNDFSVYSN